MKLRTAGAIAAGLSLALVGPAPAQEAPPTDAEAADLVDRSFRNLYADDYVQGLWLRTRSRGGGEMARQLQITRKQTTRPGKAMVRFLAPYAVRHTAILVLEREDASDDLYVYMPAMQRTLHLSSAQRADSFFGTDLAYEDLEPKYASDYEITALGRETHGGLSCVKVRIRPRPHFESTYEFLEGCVEPERAIMLWTDFHRRGRHWKRLEIDPDEVRPIQDRFIPFRMTMSTVGRQSETVVETESYELRPEIPDRIFSVFNLESGDARRDRERSAGGGRDDADRDPAASADQADGRD